MAVQMNFVKGRREVQFVGLAFVENNLHRSEQYSVLVGRLELQDQKGTDTLVLHYRGSRGSRIAHLLKSSGVTEKFCQGIVERVA